MKILRNGKVDAIKILTGYGFYVSIFFTVLLCLSSPVYADGQRNEVYSAASILSQFDEKSMLEHGEMNSFVVSMTGNLGVVLGVSMAMSGGRWGSNWSDVVTKYQSIYPNEAGNFASQLLPSNLYNQILLYRAVIQTFVLLMAYLLLLALTSKFCAIT